jgi:hypothetical protein
MLTDVERRYSQCEKGSAGRRMGLREGANLPYQAIILTIVTIGQSSSQPDLWKRKVPIRQQVKKGLWALRLTQFDFSIVHRTGNTYIADYYSSRSP